MKNIFIDTNIVIDLLTKREPFYIDAQDLFSLSLEEEAMNLYVSSLTFANAHYLLRKHTDTKNARTVLSKFKVLVHTLSFDETVVELALASDFNDFEDAIQYNTALEHKMDVIITRNKKDFKHSAIPVLDVKEFLQRLKALKG